MLYLTGSLRSNLQITTIALAFVLFSFSCHAQQKNDADGGTASPITKQAPVFEKATEKVIFSSAYTKLDYKKCQPIAKAESPEDEIPLICDGYKNYKIFVSEHGVLPPIYIGREISADVESWDSETMPSFITDQTSNGQVIEWRLADGEPFACVVRARYEMQIIEPDAKGEKNVLVVKNLKGFAPIEVSIDSSKNKKANEEARRAADEGYRKL